MQSKQILVSDYKNPVITTLDGYQRYEVLFYNYHITKQVIMDIKAIRAMYDRDSASDIIIIIILGMFVR